MQVQFPSGRESTEFLLAWILLLAAGALLLFGAALLLFLAPWVGVAVLGLSVLLAIGTFAAYSASRGSAKSAAPVLTHRSGNP
jgi:hypothetical protein